MLEYEIERVIPLPRDEVFFDYQVRTSGEGEAARLAVLVVSVPRRLIQLYLDALDGAGLVARAAPGLVADGGDAVVGDQHVGGERRLAGAVALLAAPLAWQATTTLFREYEARTLVKGNQGTIMLQAAFGLLMAVGMGASTLF